MKLVLASGSNSRKQLLERIGLKPVIHPSDFDEDSLTEENPEKYVETLAYEKAKSVADHYKSAAIIGADTVTVLGPEIIQKPKYKMDAVEYLTKLSGNIHCVLTGWCLIIRDYKKSSQIHKGTVVTNVTFRTLDKEEIVHYCNDYPVTEWAAGYNPQLSTAAGFVDNVEGSYTGFYGLPLEKILPLLNQA